MFKVPQPQPPRLKELPEQKAAGEAWYWRAVSRVARQRWLTVGALLVVGVGGIVAADSLAEAVVARLGVGQDEEDF